MNENNTNHSHLSLKSWVETIERRVGCLEAELHSGSDSIGKSLTSLKCKIDNQACMADKLALLDERIDAIELSMALNKCSPRVKRLFNLIDSYPSGWVGILSTILVIFLAIAEITRNVGIAAIIGHFLGF